MMSCNDNKKIQLIDKNLIASSYTAADYIKI